MVMYDVKSIILICAWTSLVDPASPSKPQLRRQDLSGQAMRHAEQFESESAVWQVKNVPWWQSPKGVSWSIHWVSPSIPRKEDSFQKGHHQSFGAVQPQSVSHQASQFRCENPSSGCGFCPLSKGCRSSSATRRDRKCTHWSTACSKFVMHRSCHRGIPRSTT